MARAQFISLFLLILIGTVPVLGQQAEIEIVAYFPEWGAELQGFHVKNLVDNGSAGKITTLIYSFVFPAPDSNGAIVARIDDPYAAYQRIYAASESVDGSADETSQSLRGHFNQLRKLKAESPSLKILVALGGWTRSTYFSDAALTADSRQIFVQSCIDQFIYGNLPEAGNAGGTGVAAGIFDGFDIDWEYPIAGGDAGVHHNSNDDVNLTALLQEFRGQLGQAKTAVGRDVDFLLTLATPASDFRAQNFQINSDQQFVDWFNLMTYDFHGGWDNTTGHLTNLLTSPDDPSSDAFKLSMDATVRLYRSTYGVVADKLVAGATFYGRGWKGVRSTDDGLYQPGHEIMGLYEPGADYYRDLPLSGPGYSLHWDDQALAAWLYSPTDEVFWSFDEPQSLALKRRYVDAYNLRGIMFWEISGDENSGTLLDSLFTSNPPPPTITPGDNSQAPVVSLTKPIDCELSFEGFNQVINAHASDDDGEVVAVEFFADGQSLGYDTQAPYSWAWFNLPPGSHEISAQAMDNNGVLSPLSLATVTVYAASSGLTLWETGVTYQVGERVFYLGCIYEAQRLHVGSRVREPKPGSHYWALVACSECDGGNWDPSVSITLPADGAVFTEGDLVSIEAEASDPDGSVAQVEFFSGSSSLCLDSGAPFSCEWTPGAGNYSLTAVATDNSGATATSEPVQISVQPVGGGGCNNPEWIPGIFYPRGELVSHNDHEWKAKRDNTNVEPGTSHSMWTDLGLCGG